VSIITEAYGLVNRKVRIWLTLLVVIDEMDVIFTRSSYDKDNLLGGALVEESKQLKDAGLKITVPRLKVLQILELSRDHHLSAEDLYKGLIEMGEDVGLATVYRVLTQFEAVGLIKRHNFEGGHSVFELNQGSHHDHLVCVKCGRVDEFVDDIIEARQKMIAEQAGFQMTDHALNIYGFCGVCITQDA
jgi:Fur family ferric uptake transcriptional regulator